MVQLAVSKVLDVRNILKDFYCITENGTVFKKSNGRILRTKIDKDGYARVSLCTNEVVCGKEHKRKMFGIADLVLRQFKGEPPETMVSPTVDHIDGNKQRNHVSNLRWLERSENSSTRKKRGTGSENASAILSEEDVKEIRQLLKSSNLSFREIGSMYGVSKSTISNIKRNKAWRSVTGRL